MKYKIGDKVKVLDIDVCSSSEDIGRFLNKIKTIVHIWADNEKGYFYGLENENWSPLYFKEEQLEYVSRDHVVGLSKEDIAFLKELQQEMLTQDHVSQAGPRFWVVRGTVREYGIEVGWSDGVCLRVDTETMLNDMKEAYEYLLEYHSKTPYKYNEDDTIDHYDSVNEGWVELSNLGDVCEFLKEKGEDEAELVGYKDVERIFEDTMFLTNRECKTHIKANYYHYPKDAHSYAMTAWRSQEVSGLWDILDKINWDEIEKYIQD